MCRHEWKAIYGAYWAIDWILFRIQHDRYRCEKCGKKKIKRWIEL